MRGFVEFMKMVALLKTGLWFSLGFAYADMGLLVVSIVFAIISVVLVILGRLMDQRAAMNEMYEFVRYGDEMFLRDMDGVLLPSSRSEVAALYEQDRLLNWKKPSL
jgi:hypothetical protein